MRQISSLLTAFCLACIHLYRILVSPLFPAACRFEPTCSRYADQALRTHGLLKGGRLAVHRICQCHPWKTGGYDPVPEPLLRNCACHTATRGAER